MRVAIDCRSAGHRWEVALESGDTAKDTVRMHAIDLRDARQKSAAIKAEARHPVTVIMDIEVMIDVDARSAHTALSRLSEASQSFRVPKSALYVGTSDGLVGLIADMQALGIADGVTLLPLTLPVLERIIDEVLPQLQRVGFDPPRQQLEVLRLFRAATELRAARRPYHTGHRSA